MGKCGEGGSGYSRESVCQCTDSRLSVPQAAVLPVLRPEGDGYRELRSGVFREGIAHRPQGGEEGTHLHELRSSRMAVVEGGSGGQTVRVRSIRVAGRMVSVGGSR